VRVGPGQQSVMHFYPHTEDCPYDEDVAGQRVAKRCASADARQRTVAVDDGAERRADRAGAGGVREGIRVVRRGGRRPLLLTERDLGTRPEHRPRNPSRAGTLLSLKSQKSLHGYCLLVTKAIG
jgi:hypothetical protein